MLLRREALPLEGAASAITISQAKRSEIVAYLEYEYLRIPEMIARLFDLLVAESRASAALADNRGSDDKYQTMV